MTAELEAALFPSSLAQSVSMIRCLSLVVAASLVSCSSLLGQTSRAKVQEAVRAAEQWLSLIHERRFQESWDSAARPLQALITKDEWVARVTAVQQAIGHVLSRELVETEYTTSLPDAPPGEYVVVRFLSRYENMDSVPEIVVPKLEEDGIWRVSVWRLRQRMTDSLESDSARVLQEQGVGAAFDWLSLIDQGLYQESWEAAADTFRASTPSEDWVEMLTQLRQPLGMLEMRIVRGRSYTKHLFGWPEGDYVIVAFGDSFQDDKSAVEVVSMRRERDGSWAVIGYSIVPGG